jgi:formyl-CoA transferase
MLVEWEHPAVGHLRQTAPPVRFGTMPTPLVEQIPLLGEHTDEVLAELGRTPEQISALRDSGAIRPS